MATASSHAPRVSAIMSVFNAAPFLDEAIGSVLRQSWRDLELIAVDDGSTDESPAILRKFAEKDDRIRILTQPNQGTSAARNAGHALSRGEYLAVVDADDIYLPGRFARQVEFLDRHPDIGVCGGWIENFGIETGIGRFPTEDTELRCELLFSSALAHSTVMMRRAWFDLGHLRYREELRVAHDYDLWIRAVEHGRIANLPEVLTRYRRHPSQITHSLRRDRSRNETRELWTGQLQRLGIAPDPGELATHERLAFWVSGFSPDEVRSSLAWLKKLRAANDRAARYPSTAFDRMLGRRAHWACTNAAVLGPWAWSAFWASPLARPARLSFAERLKFWLKCWGRPHRA